MMDFSTYIQSEWSWVVMAVFVGMSKTGVLGLAILTVPLLAMTFGAKPSPERRLHPFTLDVMQSALCCGYAYAEAD